MERMCQAFKCKLRGGGRYCCADCSTPCTDRCLNTPARCNLVDAGVPAVPRKRTKPKRLTEAEKAQMRRLMLEGAMTRRQIAAQFGISVSTVTWYAYYFRREMERDG